MLCILGSPKVAACLLKEQETSACCFNVEVMAKYKLLQQFHWHSIHTLVHHCALNFLAALYLQISCLHFSMDCTLSHMQLQEAHMA